MSKNIIFLSLFILVVSMGFCKTQDIDSIEIEFKFIKDQRVNLSGIEQLVIDSDSLYYAVIAHPDSMFLKEVDFSEEMIIIKNTFTDNNAKIEYRLVYVQKEGKIVVYETLTDGGSAGMKFSSFWILIKKPVGYKNLETITNKKRCNNY